MAGTFPTETSVSADAGAGQGVYIPRTADSGAGTMSIDQLNSQPRRLHRSPVDRWLGGVCGGIAETYEWSAQLIRLLFVASIVLPGPQVLFYLLAWMIMPKG